MPPWLPGSPILESPAFLPTLWLTQITVASGLAALAWSAGRRRQGAWRRGWWLPVAGLVVSGAGWSLAMGLVVGFPLTIEDSEPTFLRFLVAIGIATTTYAIGIASVVVSAVLFLVSLILSLIGMAKSARVRVDPVPVGRP